MNNKIARVRWEMGQVLLPDKFTALEDSILSDTQARLQMIGLPVYGISSLKYNEINLQSGILSIENLQIIMRSGVLLNVPYNATVAPFDLNVIGSVNVPIFCHLLNKSLPSIKVNKNHTDENEASVVKNIYQLELSTKQALYDSIYSLKIAEFEKNPEGIWTSSASYIPCLVQVGKSPFLISELHDIMKSLKTLELNLKMSVSTYLSGSELISIKNILKSIAKLLIFLSNLIYNKTNLHPYFLYEKLINFYIDFSIYQNMKVSHEDNLYDHEDLTKCFRDILNPLKEQIQLTKTQSPYSPFEYKDGLYKLKLSEEIRNANEIYLMVQKGKLTQKFSRKFFKLSCLSRLTFVYERAIVGIPLQKINQLPFQHSFGPEVEFYKIQFGEEWDHALSELSVAFYDQPELKEMKFFLYRR